jgi:hypothetical protein
LPRPEIDINRLALAPVDSHEHLMPSTGDRQFYTLTTLDLGYLRTIDDDAVAPRSIAPAAAVSRHDNQRISVFCAHRQVILSQAIRNRARLAHDWLRDVPS